MRPPEPDDDTTWVERQKTWGAVSNVPWHILEDDEGPVRYEFDGERQDQGVTVGYWVRVPEDDLDATVEVDGHSF